MKKVSQNIFFAFVFASVFSLSVPSIAVHAKDKKQCASGEKWDKRKQECVEASSY